MNTIGNEDLARLRVKESLKSGLQSQAVQRALGRRRKKVPNNIVLVIFLAILVAITLGACSGIAVTTASLV